MLVTISVECQPIADWYGDRELVDSLLTLSQWLVDSRSVVGWYRNWLSVVIVQTHVDRVLVKCWWNIGQVSVIYQSTVPRVSVLCLPICWWTVGRLAWHFVDGWIVGRWSVVPTLLIWLGVCWFDVLPPALPIFIRFFSALSVKGYVLHFLMR